MRKQAATRPYYGWYITLTLVLTETLSWGILYYAFSVFLSPMETDLGWSRSELNQGWTLGLLVMRGMAFPVGMWSDKHGPRLLITIASTGAAQLVIAWSRVNGLPVLNLIWAGIGLGAEEVL